MTEQAEIVRPRLSQLELFSIVELLNDKCRETVQNQTPYVKHLKRLRRKLKRNLKIGHVSYEAKSNRVPYVKTEQPKAETPKETLREKAIREGTIAPTEDKFLAFNY